MRMHLWHKQIGTPATIAILLLGSFAGRGEAQNSVTPGTLSSPFPTFENLSFEWEINGDDNTNGTVDLRYRRAGTAPWNDGMPLRRIPGGFNTSAKLGWTNKFSGSLFKLQPGTDYEIELTMNDLDGGFSQQTLNVQTRAFPKLNQGNIIELEPGFQGVLNVQSGTPGNPNIYRSKFADNPAIYSQVNMIDKSNVYIVGLKIDNPNLVPGTSNNAGIYANGASNFVIARNEITALRGIEAIGEATNGYIVDNVLQGPAAWTEANLGDVVDFAIDGIRVSGPGNVVSYNHVRGFKDNISTLEDGGNLSLDQRSNDIHNNEITLSSDDAIEADFTQGNVRVMENRITDAYVGISTQPTIGGPAYILRNSMYNVVLHGIKPLRFSRGDVFLHNTIVKIGSGLTATTSKEWDRALFRNNLAMGGEDIGVVGCCDTGDSRPIQLRGGGSNNDFDYDAVGVTAASPNQGRIEIAGTFFDFEVVEENGIVITGISAADMAPLFPGVSQPTNLAEVLILHSPQDLRPGPTSVVVDSGQIIPGINDDFLGAAPDRGAYESGRALPVYGVRATFVGDYDQDFDVDADDLAVWQASFGSTVVDPGSDADGNGNGEVDGADLLAWQRNFGLTFRDATSAGIVQGVAENLAVPEPSGFILFGVGIVTLLVSRSH